LEKVEKMGHSEEMIQKAIAQENGKVHVNAQSIPEKYQQKRADEAGVRCLLYREITGSIRNDD
jgi:hypothetical protein